MLITEIDNQIKPSIINRETVWGGKNTSKVRKKMLITAPIKPIPLKNK
jgi:hypothetical protein